MRIHKNILALILLLLSSNAFSDCGKLCDLDWWKSGPTIEDLKSIIESGADINGGYKKWDFSPLHFSAAYGSPEQVRLLLKSGAKIRNSVPPDIDYHGGNPLLYVSWRKADYVSIGDILIKAGANVNGRDKKANTPLIKSTNTNLKYMKFLIDSGANVNDFNEDGDSALHSAVWETVWSNEAKEKDKRFIKLDEEELKKMVKLLIDSGADVNLGLGENGSPLHKLVWGKSIKEIHKKRDPNIKHPGKPHTDILQIMLKAGAKIDGTSKLLHTALHSASWHGHPDLVKALITAGANVNARNKWGQSPIMKALYNDSILPLKLLINAGANVRVKDVDGATLLHYAAGRGEEKLGLLLKTEARQDINSRSKQGGTPIISAGGSLGATGIYALILAGADVKDRDDYGRGPLHGSTGKYETDDVVAGIKALIKAGVDVNARTSSGRTPLHQHARWSYHQEVIPVLLKAGANPKAKDENGRTPWDYIQDNEELKNTDAYWLLNDARFE